MSLRRILLVVAVAGAFGVFVPYVKGYGFLDRRLIVAYACIGPIIAGPTAADAFAQSEDRPAQGKLARVWLISWAFSAWLLLLALITVNLTNRHERLLAPNTGFLVAVECFSLTATGAAAALGATLARRWSPANIKAAFRAVFLLLIAAFFIVDRYVTGSLTTPGLIRILYIASGLAGAAALVMAARYSEK